MKIAKPLKISNKTWGVTIDVERAPEFEEIDGIHFPTRKSASVIAKAINDAKRKRKVKP